MQRLTNNHVTNLEAIIHNHEHEIGEMAKTLNYLNKHEAILFKIRRKLGDKFNQKYPKDPWSERSFIIRRNTCCIRFVP